MSVREARLCDYEKCNNPAAGTCVLCDRDACKEHLGRHYLTVAVMIGELGGHASGCLGKSAGVAVCSDCYTALDAFTRGLNQGASDEYPLSEAVAPFRDQLIELVGAFLAEKKLAKKSG